jgi:hypothetical protein
VLALFRQFGYDDRTTGADASSQNGPDARANRTVANAMGPMLFGAALDLCFWPYAFHHFLRTKNSTPSRDQDKSSYELLHGTKEDFSGFSHLGAWYGFDSWDADM